MEEREEEKETNRERRDSEKAERERYWKERLAKIVKNQSV